MLSALDDCRLPVVSHPSMKDLEYLEGLGDRGESGIGDVIFIRL